jgi:replicative DNA helicase
MNDHARAEFNLIFLMEQYSPESFSRMNEEVFTDSRARKFFCGMRDLVVSGETLDIFSAGWKIGMETAEIAELSGQYIGKNYDQWEFIVKDHFLDVALAKALNATSAQKGLDRYMSLKAEMQRCLDVVDGGGQTETTHERMKRSLVDSVELIPTGIPSIDNRIGGFAAGNFIILAGRPGTGKTALSTSIAWNMARYHSVSVDYHSYEMLDYEIRRRVIARISSIEVKKLRHSRKLTDEERATALACNDEIEQYPIKEHADGISLDALVTSIVRSDAKVIFVDYLQIVPGPKAEKKSAEVTAISNALRQAAKRSGKVIVALSQLNRESDKSATAPVLSNLRDSGAIEQDADMVFFLYDPDSIQNMKSMSHVFTVELIGAKVRDGEVGTKPITFDKAHSHFYDADSHNYEQPVF